MYVCMYVYIYMYILIHGIMNKNCLHSTSGKYPYELCRFAEKNCKKLEFDKFLNKMTKY